MRDIEIAERAIRELETESIGSRVSLILRDGQKVQGVIAGMETNQFWGDVLYIGTASNVWIVPVRHVIALWYPIQEEKYDR
jgi:hypothetical protein